ncbi:hypothetical protein L1987_05934 [Smallanthus sonchifolius]|uniref:Uncharacterized protein n=1 Tax=Smallanthus sonchifolius TaxID=185202 RepID=A0ACB9JWQ1_9ASTR|nr:hypothetical protein L1987_05934 [Smallanthus sonchifolius]
MEDVFATYSRKAKKLKTSEKVPTPKKEHSPEKVQSSKIVKSSEHAIKFPLKTFSRKQSIPIKMKYVKKKDPSKPIKFKEVSGEEEAIHTPVQKFFYSSSYSGRVTKGGFIFHNARSRTEQEKRLNYKTTDEEVKATWKQAQSLGGESSNPTTPEPKRKINKEKRATWFKKQKVETPKEHTRTTASFDPRIENISKEVLREKIVGWKYDDNKIYSLQEGPEENISILLMVMSCTRSLQPVTKMYYDPYSTEVVEIGEQEEIRVYAPQEFKWLSDEDLIALDSMKILYQPKDRHEVEFCYKCIKEFINIRRM